MIRIAQILVFALIFITSCDQSKETKYENKIRSAIRLQDEGKLPESMAKIDEALEINAKGVVALYQKGLTYILEKKFDTAIIFLNKAIQMKGSDSLYVELNQANPMVKGEFLDDVEMTVIRYCRGLSFYMLKDYDKALSDFEFSLSNGYNSGGGAFLYAGAIYLYKGLSEKACNYFGLAVRNGNSDAKAFLSKNCK